jgi:hypothetical protein
LTPEGLAPPRRWWSRAARDPITHFAILGGLLFGLNALIAGDQRPVIQINARLVDATLRERASLLNRPQTDRDRQEVIDTLVADEVLVREAYRRGYDKTPRIRAQLIQTMQLALSDEPTPPGEPALRAYYAANRDRFRRQATLSLTEVVHRDGDVPPNDATDRLDGLATTPASAIRILNAANGDLLQRYGPETAAALAAVEDHRWHGPWHGPWRGTGGVYYLRVDDHHPARTPEFEEVADVIAGEWEFRRQQDTIRDRVAELGKAYLVLAPAEP